MSSLVGLSQWHSLPHDRGPAWCTTRWDKEGQGLLLENVTLSRLFLSGNHPEEEPPPRLLIPVSGGKEAEKPELCESQGACGGG